MESIDNHYRLKDLFKNNADRRLALKVAFEKSLPLAFYAYGVFAHSAKLKDDGRMQVSPDSKLIKKAWLYVDPDALLPLLDSTEPIAAGMFGSRPDSRLDTWATWKNGEKIKLQFDDLWIHEGNLSEIGEPDIECGDSLHKRKEGNMLRIIGVLLAELRKSTNLSQAKIIQEVSDQYPLVTGMSKSNLENYFAAANRAVEDY